MMVEMMPTNQPYSSWVMPQQTMKIDGDKSYSAFDWIHSHENKRKEEAKRLKWCLKPVSVIGVPECRNLLLVMDPMDPIQRSRMEKHMRYVEPHII